MNNRERFHAIAEGRSDKCGLWHGHPSPYAEKAICDYFGVKNDYELGKLLGDTVYWCLPNEHNMWHVEGRPLWFDFYKGIKRTSLSQGGCFADCEDLEEVERYHWPEPELIDFTETMQWIDHANQDGFAVLSGMWSSFFHDLCDAFGMEEYFVRMYTDPEMVCRSGRRSS